MQAKGKYYALVLLVARFELNSSEGTLLTSECVLKLLHLVYFFRQEEKLERTRARRKLRRFRAHKGQDCRSVPRLLALTNTYKKKQGFFLEYEWELFLLLLFWNNSEYV